MDSGNPLNRHAKPFVPQVDLTTTPHLVDSYDGRVIEVQPGVRNTTQMIEHGTFIPPNARSSVRKTEKKRLTGGKRRRSGKRTAKRRRSGRRAATRRRNGRRGCKCNRRRTCRCRCRCNKKRN
tara:strand:+ start:255 stop:623 length:369 start_codon:yes stop_codon:yes gene_type:complete